MTSQTLTTMSGGLGKAVVVGLFIIALYRLPHYAIIVYMFYFLNKKKLNTERMFCLVETVTDLQRPR